MTTPARSSEATRSGPALLAIDTCLAACGAAVMRDGEVVSWRAEPMTRGHQERLASMSREVMAEAGLAFGRLDRVGVTVGPGSFTGLRVGLAFAKGLALALGRPCVGVGTLEAIAGGAPGRGPRVAVIDAGRGRVYLQAFDGAAALSGPDILAVETAVARLAEIFPSGDMDLIGPGAAPLLAALPLARVITADAPDPRVVARLAESASLAPPRPLYLRAPDATVKAA